MSKIQGKPFASKVLGSLTNEQRGALVLLLDGNELVPEFRSLLNPAYAITESDGGVSYISLETETGSKNGYLAYNDDYCVLFAFVGNKQGLAIVSIDPEAMTCEEIPEELSILELRSELEESKEAADILEVVQDALDEGDLDLSDLGDIGADSVTTPLITSKGPAVEFGKPVDVDVLATSEENIIALKPIVETMTGYSFESITEEDITKTISYASACKNGNKLTFVISGTVEWSATKNRTNLGTFVIPAGVHDLLVPVTGTILALNVSFIYEGETTNLPVPFNVVKDNNNRIRFQTRWNSNIVLNQAYFFRCEITFLLSENLAPQPEPGE